MELETISIENFYKLIGSLNANNASSFTKEIYQVFEKYASVTINIELLYAIDTTGVAALKGLHDFAVKSGKGLNITGIGCKELYEHFSAIDAA